MINDVNTSIYWNDIYLSNNHRWDLGYVTPLFINIEKKFKKKSHILVPGCGLGHDALYFASLYVGEGATTAAESESHHS